MKTQPENQRNSLNESRISHVSKNKIAVAHLLLIFLFASQGAKAQETGDFQYPSGNPEYVDTRSYKVADNARFNTSTDPAINLTMECLAANGYGQWTASSSMGSNVEPTTSPNQWIFSPDQIEVNGSTDWNTSTTNFGWFLLGNQIGKPSESNLSGSPGCQPPGVVSGGKFIAIPKIGGTTNFDAAHCKVATNLTGSVRYVCVDPDDCNKFIVQGLNDSRGFTTSDRQIDIPLNSSASLLPNGISTNSAMNRQVVKAPIFCYPTTSGIALAISTGGHRVLSGGTWQDNFDIAMDEKFLYIVWCTINPGSCGGVATTAKQIFAIVVKLTDGSVVTGYPVKISTQATNCTIPTVACDVRKNPTNPAYDAAWISAVLVPVSANVTVAQIADDGVNPVPHVINSETLSTVAQKTFLDPYCGIATHWYLTALHDRVLVGSVAGCSTPVHSLYVIASGPDGAGLFLYNPLAFAGDAPIYVDGFYANAPTAVCPGGTVIPPQVVPQGFTPGNYVYGGIGVVDEPIIAFANPYGGGCTNDVQFHCMYQADVTVSGVARKPLIMVRSADCGFPGSGGGSNTRLWLNRNGSSVYTADAISHIAAPNQMGIHMHWFCNISGANTHFYARNVRPFAEDITENTLLTNENFFNGTINLTGATMTVWSDPNYGAVNGVSSTKGMYWTYPSFTSTSGFYEKSNIGTIAFGSGASLLIGTTSGGTSTGVLFTMPVCNIGKTGFEGTLEVNKGSSWDYYGSGTWKDWNSWTYPAAGLDVDLDGVSGTPATLNIHGGATFWECHSFNSELSVINILDEPNINPISTAGCSLAARSFNCVPDAFTSGVNCHASGLLRISSTATIDQSNVNSFIPIYDWFDDESHLSSDVLTNVVMLITKMNCSESSSVFALNSTSNHYTNFQAFGDASSGGAGSFILYDGRTCTDIHSIDKVVFDGDVFKRMRFHGISPSLAGLELTNNTIDDWDLNPIHIENGLNGSCTSFFGYSDITIENNTFENVLVDACDNFNHPFDPAQGILIRNFNTTGRFAQVNVNNNTFTFYDPAIGGHTLVHPTRLQEIDAAIEFDNSTGNIENNNITEDIFSIGIFVHNDVNVNIIKPYLCNNTTSNLTGTLTGTIANETGVQSDHYRGYVNLSTVNGCAVGYESDVSDNPFIVHTSITSSTKNGIHINGGSITPAEVDLRGIHTTTPCTSCDDFAANNVISSNGAASTQAQVLLEDNNQLVDLGKLPGSSWGSWGKNKIITTGTPMLIATAGLIQGAIGSIAQNNWGSIDPYTPTCPEAHFSVTYTCGETNFSPWVDSSSWFSCSGYSGSERIGSKNAQPLFAQSGYDTCTHLREWSAVNPANEVEAQRQYDTLKLYIEKCAVSDNTSWQVFHDISAADQFRSADTNRYLQYRTWLLSVLSLNRIVPEYFCACMGAIMSTYQKTTEVLAIMNYLRTNHHECWSAADQKQYSQDSATADHYGEDPNHLPSLGSLGLESLLGVPSPSTSVSSNIIEFSVSPNPAQNSVALSYSLTRQSYIQLSVLDALGKIVWSKSGASEIQGQHSISVDLNSLSSGTYYVRISTGFGEVRTLKLVHEK